MDVDFRLFGEDPCAAALHWLKSLCRWHVALNSTGTLRHLRARKLIVELIIIPSPPEGSLPGVFIRYAGGPESRRSARKPGPGRSENTP